MLLGGETFFFGADLSRNLLMRGAYGVSFDHNWNKHCQGIYNYCDNCGTNNGQLRQRFDKGKVDKVHRIDEKGGDSIAAADATVDFP